MWGTKSPEESPERFRCANSCKQPLQEERTEPCGLSFRPTKKRLAMSATEVGGLIVLGIIALDVALGYALARWGINLWSCVCGDLVTAFGQTGC